MKEDIVSLEKEFSSIEKGFKEEETGFGVDELMKRISLFMPLSMRKS